MKIYGIFLCNMISRLVPSAHKSARIAKISILKLEGIVKKKKILWASRLWAGILGYVPKKRR